LCIAVPCLRGVRFKVPQESRNIIRRNALMGVLSYNRETGGKTGVVSIAVLPGGVMLRLEGVTPGSEPLRGVLCLGDRYSGTKGGPSMLLCTVNRRGGISSRSGVIVAGRSAVRIQTLVT
jgi:hypothetical protein